MWFIILWIIDNAWLLCVSFLAAVFVGGVPIWIDDTSIGFRQSLIMGMNSNNLGWNILTCLMFLRLAIYAIEVIFGINLMKMNKVLSMSIGGFAGIIFALLLLL